MPNKKPRHFFPACLHRLQPCPAGVHSSHFGFSVFLLHVPKLLWKKLCPEGLRKMAAFKIICSRLWGSWRCEGSQQFQLQGIFVPKSTCSFHLLRQTRGVCRSPCLPKTHLSGLTQTLSCQYIRHADTFGKWLSWQYLISLHLICHLPNYTMLLIHATAVPASSWFSSPGSPGNQVLKNNHVINSSSHQQCLPGSTHQQTMAEFTSQEKLLDQNITNKQIKPKICPSTTPPKQPVSHLISSHHNLLEILSSRHHISFDMSCLWKTFFNIN